MIKPEQTQVEVGTKPLTKSRLIRGFDKWRIRHKRRYTDLGRPVWYYVLERKKRFLFWDYWKRIDSECYNYHAVSAVLEKHQQLALNELEKKRLEILEDEAASESIVKEWP
jgi:hypothetical protein